MKDKEKMRFGGKKKQEKQKRQRPSHVHTYNSTEYLLTATTDKKDDPRAHFTFPPQFVYLFPGRHNKDIFNYLLHPACCSA